MTGVGPMGSLDYTVLLCRDIEAMRAFYRDVMGFPVEQERPSWVNLRAGAAILALRPRAADEAIPAGVPAVQLAFRVDRSALNRCHADLVRQDVRIKRGPVDLPAWRHRAVFFRDPDHNIVEIYAELED